jgi:hypothetical protein
MTNERIFRGRPERDKKKWVYGRLSTYTIGFNDEVSLDIIVNDKGFHEVVSSTVGQSIGRKESKKKDIYEGDVLSVINPNGEKDRNCIVKWDEIGCCYPYRPEHGLGNFDVSTIGWAMVMGFTFTKIGNIHDNPELAEVD